MLAAREARLFAAVLSMFFLCLEKAAVLYRTTGRGGDAQTLEKRAVAIRSKIAAEPLLLIPRNWGQRL